MALLQMIWRMFLAWLVMKLSKMTQPEEPNPTNPKYPANYPEKYTKEYFQNGPNSYNWSPPYKSALSDLYSNEGSVYADRFKYREPTDY
jgi:hypothetical protein